MSNAGSILTAVQLTPRGRGAVATIGLHGDLVALAPWFTAANGISASRQQINRICFGRWGGDPAEEVVFVRTDAQQGELHCHGGPAAVQRIFQDIRNAGGVILDADESLLGTRSRLDAECQRALMRATTRKTAHHLFRQSVLLPGVVRSLETAAPEDRIAIIDRLLEWSDFGVHLTKPWKVVLCGRPNVGKSSLINALLGYSRTVVFDQPGTTRDVVAAETSLGGWPVEFSDTAGLREAEEELESAGIHLARQRLKEADLILAVLDATSGVTPDDERLLAEFPQAMRVFNKSDLLSAANREGLPSCLETDAQDASDGLTPRTELVSVSAVTGAGIDRLIELLVERLVPKEPEFIENRAADETGTPQGPAFPVSAEQIERLRQLRTLAVQTAENEFRKLVRTWCASPGKA